MKPIAATEDRRTPAWPRPPRHHRQLRSSGSTYNLQPFGDEFLPALAPFTKQSCGDSYNPSIRAQTSSTLEKLSLGKAEIRRTIFAWSTPAMPRTFITDSGLFLEPCRFLKRNFARAAANLGGHRNHHGHFAFTVRLAHGNHNARPHVCHHAQIHDHDVPTLKFCNSQFPERARACSRYQPQPPPIHGLGF
jgi:hypothetical protein